MTSCPNLLLTSTIITILFVLTALALLPYLSSSSYFPNQYVMAAHSSSSLQHHKTTGEDGIQICCSWGDQIADGILTYRIIGGSNSQAVKAVHQAIDEWNSKVPNIKLQESADDTKLADIDIKFSSKASQVSRATTSTIVGGGHAIAARKNIKLAQPGEAVISFDTKRLITHVDITISTRALGNSISSSELESIAKHEIGHAYGIGHADFVCDLMSPILFIGRTDISVSRGDINGIAEANNRN
ncbi:MAG: matrixin family metalloprotease [Nitrososphaeraceae archaeon]